ncbi:hypothetical protein K1X13_18260 [Nocardioides sp. WL0053]|uniref:Uncharacterized protein n=1 Tax=Nocardioides jiangsuensis TaxID=2866161 RepID=A0ABS7RQK8_9ACTN|nr:hypothetical protein [Nocardioides jiangsuensis]MBY9076779.1 hypothetical protein [Nocardioides jiangsuensis]
MREYDEPREEQIHPEVFLGHNGIPADARRLGFDRNTEEGAMIAMAGSLDPRRRMHRVVAWVLLLAFVLPLLLGVTRQLF